MDFIFSIASNYCILYSGSVFMDQIYYKSNLWKLKKKTSIYIVDWNSENKVP